MTRSIPPASPNLPLPCLSPFSDVECISDLFFFARRNTAAGGTHFGTWYRMHEHPEGPGFDPDICPQSVPLGEYRDNTAHSLGWFGLWIFETYVPRVGGSCDTEAEHQVR